MHKLVFYNYIQITSSKYMYNLGGKQILIQNPNLTSILSNMQLLNTCTH